MHVQAMLQTKGASVVTTRPDETILATTHLLRQHRIGAVIVVDGADKVVGVISERDIVAGLAAHGPAVAEHHVADLMTRDVLVCSPEDSIDDIMVVMTQRRVRHLPVVVDDRLIGIVSIGDVVKSRLDEAAMEVDSLRQYVLAGR